MSFAKRIILFLAVNILIIVTISIVLSLLGVRPYLTAYGIDYKMLAIFCLVWGMGGAFISLALSRVMVKWMMGVQVIPPDTTNGDAAELVALVHKIAKSAGMNTMPEVGVYDSREVNAFATGPTASRSIVAVSTGLLQRMNSKELEGVLGHEMSHIVNGDMVTMTLLQGIVNAFVMFLARVIAFFVSQNAKGESRRTIFFLVTIVLEILFSLLGAMVVMAFSRHREFKADAGSAGLVGRDTMISALKALKNTIPEAEPHPSMASLKISGKRKGGFMALLASHPSLEERIAALEMFQG